MTGAMQKTIDSQQARIAELEKAAWKVVEEVSLPPPGDYYYSETDWVTMEELKQALLGGGDA